MHGCGLVTEDLDICAPFNRDNIKALLAALDGLHACWRTTPKRPPLLESADQLAAFKNLNLVTDSGILDVLGEIAGLGDDEEVSRHAIDTQFGTVACRVLDLPALIRAKRTLGRPTDLRAAIELEAIQQRLKDEQKPT